MRKLKKYITNPKESFTRKAHKIAERSALKYQFAKNLLDGSYSPKRIELSWDGKPKRYDLINAAISKFGYKNYLEIGCFKDTTFNRVVCDKKVGVDPVIGGNVRMTSDDFFAQNKEKFDCIFIDGLHHYAQVLKDIKNAIDCLADGGTIFIDDCLPLKYEYQTVPPSHLVWNGDVWKAIVEARTWDNVETAVCLIDHGQGIIKKRKNSDKLNLNTVDFLGLKYPDLADNYSKWLNTIAFEKALEFAKN
jgi:SAM-dependent methyltransferase